MAAGEGRTFREMLAAAKRRLAGRPPGEIAEKARAAFDPERAEFRFSSLGEEIVVRYPSWDVGPGVDPWRQLIILHYLDRADGTPPGRRLIPFGELRDGMVRGGGFDRACEGEMARYFSRMPLETLRAACRALGAEPEESNADLCAALPFLPRCPVVWKLWLAEEEDDIGGSGRLFLDSGADGYLSVEDAVTAGELILERLRRECS